ncbi:MAG: hypothetical protein CVU97_00020 [Firmicutes bacterium HGW-Firmicutes-21]|nr:MAG: hypothetical protein CVU97_00020 [Firmicutes bacterium HGW-Firmicutes-21]
MKKHIIITAILVLAFMFTSCFADIQEEESVQEVGKIDTSENNDSKPESEAPERTTADFYIPNEDIDGFVTVNAEFDGTIEGLIAHLVELNALPEGTSVISFKLEEATASIDLSKPFEDAMNGTAMEYMLIGSLVNTIIDFYNIQSVSFTVEGNILDTGHNIYNEPISRLS